MSQPTVMLIEASGIQPYIFGSNELAQHIGASELVTQATTDWLFAEKDGLLPRPHNVTRAPAGSPARWQLGPRGLADGLAAEVVYAGGGNALLLFADPAAATGALYKLTRQALREAPGLRLVAAHRPYAPGALREAVADVRAELARRKRAPEPTAALLGLSVTAECDFTGRPATAIDERGRYVSAEVVAKQRAGRGDGDGAARLAEYFVDIARHGFGFITDFSDLGARDESSYLAVVHTDGNRMAERIAEHVTKQTDAAPGDRTFIEAQRAFSERVQAAAYAALVSTAGLLIAPANLKSHQDDRGRTRRLIGEKVPVVSKQGQDRLPFRPIVFGGDDITFVCEGRLGLPLAAHYLARLAETTLPDGKPLYARAGVAIVKTHYPFARAYALADELCASAKRRIAEVDPLRREATALDWHFAVTGLVQPLKALRAREYRGSDPASTLLLRPLQITGDPRVWRSWDTFCELTDEFTRPKGLWAGRRNKLKALREALRAGPDSVTVFLRSLPRSGDEPWPPQLPYPAALRTEVNASSSGWAGGRCVYFDALEALDFNVPLKEV